MSRGERRLSRTISQRIALAPKRERGGCAFRKCCEERCLEEVKRVPLHSGTAKEILKAASASVERINLLSESEEGSGFEASSRIAGKLAQIIKGAAIPIDYSGTIDYSFCGDSFKIQTYSLEEMREILADAPLSISMKSAYVSALRDGRPTGLSAEFAELLAWIAALKISEGERLDGLMRFGGVNGIRAIARMAGEPAIDEKARKKFMLASCILASCISITDGKVLAKNEELAEKISNFSTMEAYSTVSSGTARRREFGGLPCPLPSASPEPHMMRQMALVCISALFQANMNLANRIDSIINSGEREIEENSERLRGMYECLKIGLRTFLNGETISAKTMESFADGKMRELHGGAPHAERKDNMDPGEQSIIRYAVSRLLEETRMDMMLLEQFYRMLPASKSCPREIRQKMDRLLFA